MSWWYLSFATDAGFRGAAIVDAGDMAAAVLRATELGINPGGEVAGLEWPSGEPLPEDMRLRLLSKEEIVERLDAGRIGDQPPEVQAAFDEHAERVCEEHNK